MAKLVWRDIPFVQLQLEKENFTSEQNIWEREAELYNEILERREKDEASTR